MPYNSITPNRHDKTEPIFMVFSVWSFILLCRPQDYLSFLETLRPSLTFGIITLLIYFFSKKNIVKISNDNQFRLYVYLIMIMIISAPFSLYPSASIKDVFNYASITTMFYYLFYQLVNTTAKLLRLLFVYCTGVAVYAVYILKYGDFRDGRIFYGTMFDPNDIAFFIISFITFNIILITTENSGYKKIISAINIMLGLLVIFKTGSRSGVIALMSILAYLMLVKNNAVKLTFMTKAVLILIAVGSLQFVNVNSERYKTILNLNTDYNFTDEEGRIAIWKCGMRMMLSRPITGVGMNRFNEGVGRDREERGLASAKWQAPHNSILQIGAETGLFGLILFCLMSFNVFKITGQIISKSRSEELIKICEVTRVGFIGLFISAMFISQAYSIYWIFYIALSAVLKSLLDKETKEYVAVVI